MYAYAGSRTDIERGARGEGISVFDYRPDTGTLELRQVMGGMVNPSYLLPHPTLPVLYTVHGYEGNAVSALKRDPQSGRIALWHTVPSGGENPVHLVLSPSGKYLMVSNHHTGTLAVFPVGPDGALSDPVQQVPMRGEPGPHRIQQKFAKPHFNPVDVAGRYVVIPDKGLDRIFTFKLGDTSVHPEPACDVRSRSGAGPRHCAFHPSRRHVYVVNELDNTVGAYHYDDGTGALRPFQVLPTLPDTYTGDDIASAIMIDRAGRHLYVSNRGHDSIAIFDIDPASGRLAPAGHHLTLGDHPRFCTLSPDERFVFALNERSHTLVRLRRDPDTGQLSDDGYQMRIGSPVCLVFD
jgi:6-phosphogluconolactonase (cycloisomerase 2 family)